MYQVCIFEENYVYSKYIYNHYDSLVYKDLYRD